MGYVPEWNIGLAQHKVEVPDKALPTNKSMVAQWVKQQNEGKEATILLIAGNQATAEARVQKSNPSVQHKGVEEANKNKKSNNVIRNLSPPAILDIYNEYPKHELDISNIDGTFALHDVVLSDYSVGQICKTKLRIVDCYSRYLFDFNACGLPLKSQVGQGQGVYTYNDEEELCFAIVCSTTQLHGKLDQSMGLSLQVPRQKALREKVCAGDYVVTEEARGPKEQKVKKKGENTSTKSGKSMASLEDLPMLEAEFDEPEKAGSTIAPNIARTMSKLDRVAVCSMKLTQELIGSWGKRRTWSTN